MSLAPSPTQSNILTALRSFILAVLPSGMDVIHGQEMPATQHYIYIHAKPDGRPFYIGKGSGRRGIRVRNKNRNKFHQDIVSHYGVENILVGIVLCDDAAAAFRLEYELIAGLRRENHPLANFNDGGEGGLNPSAETRVKMSVAKKGKPMSEETKRKISQTMTGKPKSPEHNAAVSAGLKAAGCRPSPEAKAKSLAVTTGVKQPEELVRKRADANRGKKRSDEFRAHLSLLAKARRDAGTLKRGRHEHDISGA